MGNLFNGFEIQPVSKIEIECKSCQSILRVDARHAGKNARCPHCGGFTLIPGGESKAVPSPDSASMPFDEEFYQDEPHDSIAQTNNPETDDRWNDDWDRRTAPYPARPDSDYRGESRGSTQRTSRSGRRLEVINEYNTREPDTPYYPTVPSGERTTTFAPLHAQPQNRGSMASGIFGLFLLVISVFSLPVCFCITPFLLAAAKGLSDRSPEGLKSVLIIGVWILVVIWAGRISALFLIGA